MAFVFLQISTVCLIILLNLFYVYLKKCRSYWADKGVPYLKPSNLLFGSVADLFVFNVPEIRHNLNIYRRLAPHKFGGYYAFHRPRLVIRDPELLKAVLTKDFAYFYDRNPDIFSDQDILSFHLFNLTGERWKRLRARLTPTFTSGKMKSMFDITAERGESMLRILERSLLSNSDDNNNNNNNNDIEVKDLMARYTIDVIASCAFGLEAGSLENPDTPLRRIAGEPFRPSWKTRVFISLMIIWPTIFKRLNVKVNSYEDFYRKLVTDTVDYRIKNGLKRNDFFGLLMAIGEDEKTFPSGEINGPVPNERPKLEMTTDLMAAQCFQFLAAGFESSSSAISFALLELSKDTKIQQKLRDEIEHVLGQTGGEVTYKALKMMKYMDQVLSETLRLYPPVTAIQRVCTETYTIPDTNVIVEKGTIIEIPVAGIHYDPQYYPNPEQFDPDNFSEQAKNSRPPYTYLAFGEGQKICTGMRFGLMQSKLALALLLKNYEFKLSNKMKLPLEYTSGPQQVPTSIHGIRLSCRKLIKNELIYS